MAPHSPLPLPANLKQALRSDLFARRAAIAPELRASAAATIASCADRLAHDAAGPVSAFWPLGDEIDPRPLLRALSARGVGLALPRVTPGGLTFHRWRDGDPLDRVRFGLLEPRATAVEVEPALMLVPLLGFDRTGHRIGYGKAYYDRALARVRPRLAIGLAFSCQEVASVPVEPHDEPLDAILTETGRIDIRRPPRQEA